MSQAREVSKSAPGSAARFDALKLSANGGALAGRLDASTLPRLADRLAPRAGPAPIDWSIAGGRDAQGRPALTLTLKGTVPLICQRCLGLFAAAVTQSTLLLIARDDAELKRLDSEEPEVLLASAPLEVQALIEDELLLSLPFAPRHPDDACAANIDQMARASGKGGTAAAFAKLAKLKKRID